MKLETAESDIIPFMYLINYQLIITLSQSNKDSMRSSTWARTEAFQVDHTSTGWPKGSKRYKGSKIKLALGDADKISPAKELPLL